MTEKQVTTAIKQALDDMDGDDLARTYNFIIADEDETISYNLDHDTYERVHSNGPDTSKNGQKPAWIG